MKKSNILSLVLITSALASCHTSRPSYVTQYDEYKPPRTDTIPDHWQRAYQPDSSLYDTDGYFYEYYLSPIFDYRLPVSFYPGPYLPLIERGGFGHFGTVHSLSS